MIRSRIYPGIVITVCIFIFTAGVMAAEKLPRPLPGTMNGTAGTGKRFITIDFDNVDIRLFIKYISELTGKNFVVDKTVQGNVTIVSPTKISPTLDTYKNYKERVPMFVPKLKKRKKY